MDGVELDRAWGDLRCRGRCVVLRPSVAVLFRVLVAATPHVVSHGVLRSVLWPIGTAVPVVAEESLRVSVVELRAALLEIGAPLRVVTVRERGYALARIAAARWRTPESDPVATSLATISLAATGLGLVPLDRGCVALGLAGRVERISRGTAKLFRLLQWAWPGLVEHAALLAALFPSRPREDAAGQNKVLRQRVVFLRQALRALDAPVELGCRSGVGYGLRVVPAAGGIVAAAAGAPPGCRPSETGAGVCLGGA